jgi:DNA-binding LytR/AlgR family response regulator
MRCFIIDDDNNSVDIITDHINQTPFLTLVGASNHPIQAKKVLFEEKEKIDILFMAIKMKKVHGIKLAMELREYSDIIFTTSQRGYGPEAFELDAIDYLLKPISYERFNRAVEKYLKQNTTRYIFVKSIKKGKFVRIDCNEILFVESQLNYLKFHLTEREPISTAMTVNELAVKLRIHPFITRIHRSYLVNKSKISHIEDKKVFLTDKRELPISNTYYKNLISVI